MGKGCAMGSRLGSVAGWASSACTLKCIPVTWSEEFFPAPFLKQEELQRFSPKTGSFSGLLPGCCSPKRAEDRQEGLGWAKEVLAQLEECVTWAVTQYPFAPSSYCCDVCWSVCSCRVRMGTRSHDTGKGHPKRHAPLQTTDPRTGVRPNTELSLLDTSASPQPSLCKLICGMWLYFPPLENYINAGVPRAFADDLSHQIIQDPFGLS